MSTGFLCKAYDKKVALATSAIAGSVGSDSVQNTAASTTDRVHRPYNRPTTSFSLFGISGRVVTLNDKNKYAK